MKEAHHPAYRNTTYFQNFWNIFDIVIVFSLAFYFIILFLIKPLGFCNSYLFFIERLSLSLGNSLVILRILENLWHVCGYLWNFGFFINGFMRVFSVIPVFILMVALLSACVTLLTWSFICRVPYDYEMKNIKKCYSSEWIETLNSINDTVVHSVNQPGFGPARDEIVQCGKMMYVDIFLLPFGSYIYRGTTPIQDNNALDCYPFSTVFLVIAIKILFYLTAGFALLRGTMR